MALEEIWCELEHRCYECAANLCKSLSVFQSRILNDVDQAVLTPRVDHPWAGHSKCDCEEPKEEQRDL